MAEAATGHNQDSGIASPSYTAIGLAELQVDLKKVLLRSWQSAGSYKSTLQLIVIAPLWRTTAGYRIYRRRR